MKTTYIYTLSDPENHQVRYVGKSNNPHSRFNDHLRGRENTHKAFWVKSLANRGLMPVLSIVANVPLSQWQFAEREWIKYYKSLGHKLTNGDNGGLGRTRSTPELNRKISVTLKGKKNPKQWIPINQYSLDGVYLRTFPSSGHASEYCNVCRASIFNAIFRKKACAGYLWSRFNDNAGINIESPYVNGKIPISNETRERLSSALIGKNKGKKASPETRAKQSLARLGKPPANKGIPCTEEKKKESRLLSKTRKTVLQLSMSGEELRSWDSIQMASRATGATRCGIAKCCRGKGSHAGGYLWKFEN